jgi:hypothetical protein
MKVGLSLSRCVRDIYQSKIDINDVIVIVARTNFDPEDDDQWRSIWEGYGGGQRLGSPWSQPEWDSIPSSDEQAVRDICVSLKTSGKLHQPRQFGAHPARLSYIWLDTFAPDEEIANNPATKAAWEKYKMLAGL